MPGVHVRLLPVRPNVRVPADVIGARGEVACEGLAVASCVIGVGRVVARRPDLARYLDEPAGARRATS